MPQFGPLEFVFFGVVFLVIVGLIVLVATSLRGVRASQHQGKGKS